MKDQKQSLNLEALKDIIEKNHEIDNVDVFLSAIGAEFDEYLSLKQAEDYATEQKTINGLRSQLTSWFQQLDNGPISKDAIVLQFLNSVDEARIVSKSQLRVLKRFQVIKRNRHNLLEVAIPTHKDAVVSSFCLLLMVVVCLLFVFLIIQGESPKPSEILFYYPIGAFIGYGIRLSYDYYWGRLNVSNHLLEHCFLVKSSN